MTVITKAKNVSDRTSASGMPPRDAKTKIAATRTKATKRAGTEQQQQHWLTDDFHDNAQGRPLIQPGQFVVTFPFQADLNSCRGEAPDGLGLSGWHRLRVGRGKSSNGNHDALTPSILAYDQSACVNPFHRIR